MQRKKYNGGKNVNSKKYFDLLSEPEPVRVSLCPTEDADPELFSFVMPTAIFERFRSTFTRNNKIKNLFRKKKIIKFEFKLMRKYVE